MKSKIFGITGRIITSIGTIVALMLAFLATLLYFSIQWMFDTWSNLSMDELVYHITTPLDGTNTDMIEKYLSVCAAPAIVLFLALVFIFLGLRQKKKYYLAMILTIVFSGCMFYFNIVAAWDELDAGNYVKSQGIESTFVEDYYVSPADVELVFPEQKRNLIYIFLESMETTYADKQNGGAFEENVIPELTQIARENEDFSGEDETLNGGYSLRGSTWTIGAMFAQTSGLPLNIAIEGNSMDTQKTFFSGAITLGDILQEAGYSQTLLLGSDATFGGRRLYFTEHGNYDIIDYNYAHENGWIPEDYRVWWGYEDQKLIEFAKEKLLELAQHDEPFNLTMLTVDTHFEDGYVCKLCPDIYGDNQYANVMACSSVQIAEFLEWMKEQDFYENTTIVMCGDHPTMDKNFCEEVEDSYARRTYTAYVNPAAETKNKQSRVYTTFDDFPTTLAAMGVRIEGDRLGLGTNLFSGRPTLTEEVGLENEQEELGKRSVFLENLANLELGDDAVINSTGKLIKAEVRAGTYDYHTGELPVEVSNVQNVENEINSVLMAVWTMEDQSDMQWIQMSQGEDGNYFANIGVPGFGYKLGEYIIHVYIVDDQGEQYFVGETIGIVE